ncbi:MAG: ATP-dependent DNA helicase RecG [Clostridiales bacterium]|nr:ATP-dependent DNA helicase RecG [Clostridiales bacterium]
MNLSEMRGVGLARMESLRAVGIVSLRDLLYTLPVRYEDRTQLVPCKEARGEVLVQGVVQEKPKFSRYNGLSRVTASLRDESGRLSLAWYNQPWMMEQLPVGETIMLYGRVGEKNGRRVLQNALLVEEPSIQPVYRAIKGIPAKSLRKLMEQALTQVDDTCPETLPNALRLRHGLCELNFALRQAHFPSSFENLKMARRRLAFEQMLMYQAALGLMRRHKEDGIPMPLADTATTDFWQTMPFPPTNAQRRVLEEVAAGLRQPRAMRRLIQGDVGCGKTALAFGAIAMVCKAGYQATMMAPTEILARQHYESAKAMLEPLGVRCGLLIGSMKAKEKKAAHQACANGEWDAVFGTHALISEGVGYQRLGLVVTDEQHRFGVRQRSSLQDKGTREEKSPHVLVMSATPIPRTLALILYGDLDVSVVDELPPGRTPVKTRVVPEEKREAMYGFLRQEVAQGRQGYVVCPLVEESEQLEDVRSAKETYADLVDGVLHGLRVGLTWGNQKADEKAAVLADFASGALDVLVSTTVIEVGVNVPNATVMIIENAQRYGLSQLHQLRGRVGRGAAASWCFLLAEENERLRILTQTNDGFLVAQKDLELRGPGDLMGTRQSGEMLQGFLLDGDVKLLEEAASCMKQLRADPALQEERAAVESTALSCYGERLKQVALN